MHEVAGVGPLARKLASSVEIGLAHAVRYLALLGLFHYICLEARARCGLRWGLEARCRGG